MKTNTEQSINKLHGFELQSMNTQRFNKRSPKSHSFLNTEFLGLIHLIQHLQAELPHHVQHKMIGIGSHMGESTMMFASTGLFSSIDVIAPFDGEDKFNQENWYTWDMIKKEFLLNTRFFDYINLIEKSSITVSEDFDDGKYDFIYIDGQHDYDLMKKIIQLYLPKVKKGGLIGGHDYNHITHPDVVHSVNEILGQPHIMTYDNSWMFRQKDLNKAKPNKSLI
jgi:hypothetical protein